MNNDQSNLEQLRLAVNRVIDQMAEENPEIGMPQICAALGAAAGVVVGTGLPPNDSEADQMLMGCLGLGFSEALKAMRQSRVH